MFFVSLLSTLMFLSVIGQLFAATLTSVTSLMSLLIRKCNSDLSLSAVSVLCVFSVFGFLLLWFK